MIRKASSTAGDLYKKVFVQLRDPAMRRTMAKTVTIEQTCGIHGIDVVVFVNELNKTLKEAK